MLVGVGGGAHEAQPVAVARIARVYVEERHSSRAQYLFVSFYISIYKHNLCVLCVLSSIYRPDVFGIGALCHRLARLALEVADELVGAERHAAKGAQVVRRGVCGWPELDEDGHLQLALIILLFHCRHHHCQQQEQQPQQQQQQRQTTTTLTATTNRQLIFVVVVFVFSYVLLCA